MIHDTGSAGNPTERKIHVETLHYRDLTDNDRELMDAAREATSAAYAPYSGVHVGAAIRTATGDIVTAANVENAAYGATICAERMAVGRANALGTRAFAAIAVTAAGNALGRDRVVSPCGACRQVLHEMGAATGSGTRVLMGTVGSDHVTIADLADLLPLPFDALSR
jgi:cytidine deaminase